MTQRPKKPISATYTPPVKDFKHQTEAKEKGARKWAFAYFMDQGTGKTKTAIDNACLLYEQGVIVALLVLTPNDVGDQWAEEQLPKNVPKRIMTRVAVWDAGRAKARRECEALCKPIANRLHILIVNHEALATARGRKLITKFLRAHGEKTMCVVDESHAFKTHTALRTRFLNNTVARFARVRRILTGTPMDRPFDLFAQMRFLHPDILGFDSFLAFKHHYGEYAVEFAMRFDKRLKRTVKQKYESLQAYQRLEELQQRIAPYVYIVRKEECTDLPPKLYTIRRPRMSHVQQALYDEMKARGLILLERAERGDRTVRVQDLGALTQEELAERLIDPRGRVEAQIKLVLALRLRQIAGGFVTETDGTVREIEPFATIPRARSLLDCAQGAAGKFIVWAMYIPELRAIHAMMRELEMPVRLVYGATPKAERADAIASFKRDPNTIGLIAHPRTLGTGMDFPMAGDVMYYSIPQSSILRTQSEDRVHRIGQKGTVNVTDFISCPADEQAMNDVRSKREVSAGILSMKASQLVERL